MTNLQEQRTISKSVATLNAFGATNAKTLINRVFVIGVLDKCAFYRRCGTQLVLRTCVQVVWLWFEISGAKLAIPANGVRMNALHRGLLKHATGGTKVATHTFLRINLPNCSPRYTATADYSYQTSQPRQHSNSPAIPKKLAPREGGRQRRFRVHRCELTFLLLWFHSSDIAGNQIENVNAPFGIHHAIKSSQCAIIGTADLCVFAKGFSTRHHRFKCPL